MISAAPVPSNAIAPTGPMSPTEKAAASSRLSSVWRPSPGLACPSGDATRTACSLPGLDELHQLKALLGTQTQPGSAAYAQPVLPANALAPAEPNAIVSDEYAAGEDSSRGGTRQEGFAKRLAKLGGTIISGVDAFVPERCGKPRRVSSRSDADSGSAAGSADSRPAATRRLAGTLPWVP